MKELICFICALIGAALMIIGVMCMDNIGQPNFESVMLSITGAVISIISTGMGVINSDTE